MRVVAMTSLPDVSMIKVLFTAMIKSSVPQLLRARDQKLC